MQFAMKLWWLTGVGGAKLKGIKSAAAVAEAVVWRVCLQSYAPLFYLLSEVVNVVAIQ